jgi:Peptidase S7, Flavivirus NS3 serine protease
MRKWNNFLSIAIGYIHGLSGSPLIDEDGKVIGIYGLVDRQDGISTLTLGIPIATYQKYLSSDRLASDSWFISGISWSEYRTESSISLSIDRVLTLFGIE